MILDEARGPARAKAGLIWHLVGGEEVATGHFRLRGGDAPMEVYLLSLGDGKIEIRRGAGSALGWNWRALDGAHLQALVMLLPESWVGAEVIQGERMLEIQASDDKMVYLPIPSR
ncbi:MAG: hypothetical protein QXH51_07110 [Candidatus Bathyarchaeia archaeon]